MKMDRVFWRADGFGGDGGMVLVLCVNLHSDRYINIHIYIYKHIYIYIYNMLELISYRSLKFDIFL